MQLRLIMYFEPHSILLCCRALKCTLARDKNVNEKGICVWHVALFICIIINSYIMFHPNIFEELLSILLRILSLLSFCLEHYNVLHIYCIICRILGILQAHNCTSSRSNGNRSIDSCIKEWKESFNNNSPNNARKCFERDLLSGLALFRFLSVYSVDIVYIRFNKYTECANRMQKRFQQNKSQRPKICMHRIQRAKYQQRKRERERKEAYQKQNWPECK